MAMPQRLLPINVQQHQWAGVYGPPYKDGAIHSFQTPLISVAIMNSSLSALCMVADWKSTDAACTRRHRNATFRGHQASVELRGSLVVVYDYLNLEVVIKAASIDTFKRHDLDFLRQFVSTAEWRSLCDYTSRCRICRLHDELNSRHSSAEEFVGLPLDYDVSESSVPSSHIVEPMATTRTPILRQGRRNVFESLHAESSSAPTFQQPLRYRPRAYDSKRKTDAKPQKLSVAEGNSSTSKETFKASPKTDIQGSCAPRMDKDGPENALHQAVFDYLTNRPPKAWMAMIARHTNREFSPVFYYFKNRREKFEGVLARREPDWKLYHKNVHFELPDGSIVPMRPSALVNWPSVRWTDEDFDRIIKEDFLPHIAYIKKQNDKKRVTIPFYAKRTTRLPDERNRMDEGEDVEQTGEHVRLFKFEL